MCVRTKTSYGCGHEYKTTNECNSSRCQAMERYHYPREGDCRDCKEGGLAISRGREGRGRYGQEMGRRSQPREAWNESSDESSPFPMDIGGGITPWGTPSKHEKEWHGPSRRKADDGWLEEHAERNTDLQTIRESMSAHSSSDRASTAIYSPNRRDGRVYEYDEEHHHEPEDESEHRHRRHATPRSLQIEIRSTHDDYDGSSRRRARHRQCHDSQESFESLHSARSSSRRYKLAPTSYTTYDYLEPHDSGYGSYVSYKSKASNGYEGAKTEPYPCSPISRILNVKPPSTTSYGVYHTGFGVGGIDIVSRTPMYVHTRRH